MGALDRAMSLRGLPLRQKRPKHPEFLQVTHKNERKPL